MQQELTELPYQAAALEPYLDEQTMQIHHDKHHAAYIEKFNQAVSEHPEVSGMTLETMLSNLELVPQEIREIVRNQGGGVYNHNFFWNSLTPSSNRAPLGELSQAMTEKFGNFETFKQNFKTAALSHFGSGWAWLVLNSHQGQKDELLIITTPNQDTPLALGLKPLITLDLWEHAYYLKYQNRKDDYLQNWWHLVNWVRADLLYTEYQKASFS